MTPETKNCQNCHSAFTIESADFAFYERMNVPAPTWCPDCRLSRKMQWMNFRHWYPRTIDGKNVLSVYAPDCPIPLMSVRQWYSDEWDAMEYGQEYDFSKPFFEQYRELYNKVPKPNMAVDLTSINSDYCNDLSEAKNCYLSTTILNSEEAYYSTTVVFSKQIFDSLWVEDSELCYQCINIHRSRGCLFSEQIDGCIDSIFLYDCRNTSNSIACVGLRNAQYHIFNQQHTKEEYETYRAELLAGGYTALKALEAEFKKFRDARPKRYAQIFHSTNVTGNYVYGSNNCQHCFEMTKGVENCKYVTYAGLGLKDSHDCYNAGSSSELLYESMLVGTNSSRVKFSTNALNSLVDITYSDSCSGSSDLFGCVGLKKKQYCILNKQYSKEEYEELLPKVIAHMNEMPYVDKAGRMYKYGEFFPSELSPYAYNETIAVEYFPLNKAEALGQGLRWRDVEERAYNITMPGANIPNSITETSDAITAEVIACEHGSTSSPQVPGCGEKCTKAFKITPMELAFYRQMQIPIPHLCPNCRYATRFKTRTLPKLWHRECNCGGLASANGTYQNTGTHVHGASPCPNAFETSYAPDRPEIVYCETCYQAEVV